MEYHSDRFTDCSLLVFNNEKLKAVLPANRTGDEVFSHQGLTYGGLVHRSTSVSEMEDAFGAVLEFLKKEGFVLFNIKIPAPFISNPYSSALEYFLVQKGAKIMRRDLNYALDLRNEVKLHKSKRKKLAAIDTSELQIEKTEDLSSFWNEILKPVLSEKYDSKPVHTLEEIMNLKKSFPEHILQYNVMFNGMPIAGMTLFLNGKVVKSQYGTANKLGEEYRALDWLYTKLFTEYKNLGYHYFDMGTTNTNGGKDYNKGLSKYKEEFGALPMNMDYYKLTL
ncbi:FemAB family protein [Aureisphaera sp.]